MGSLIGYARVSTAEQSADLQTDELTAAGCLKVFVEQVSRAVDPGARSWTGRWAGCGRGTRWSCGAWTGSGEAFGI